MQSPTPPPSAPRPPGTSYDEPERATPADLARVVEMKPVSERVAPVKKAPPKKTATAKAPAKKAPPKKTTTAKTTATERTRREGTARVDVSYFSSALVSPSTRRAMISCWICWVPSKMSRIFESRAHFSSSSASL